MASAGILLVCYCVMELKPNFPKISKTLQIPISTFIGYESFRNSFS